MPFPTDRLMVVAGHVSNGDFHLDSPKPVVVTDPIKGTIQTPVGCSISDVIS